MPHYKYIAVYSRELISGKMHQRFMEAISKTCYTHSASYFRNRIEAILYLEDEDPTPAILKALSTLNWIEELKLRGTIESDFL